MDAVGTSIIGSVVTNEDDGLVGIIIGCIIGGLIFLGLTVSCIVCLVCMSIKSQGNRGRVIAPLPQQQRNSNVAFVSTHTNWTNSSYPTQQQTAGYPMGYTQYTRPTGNFPQPPAYEERATPGTAPPEYPEPSELYRSHNHLQPLEGASTSAEQIPAALPPIAHTGMDTSKV
ncbi:uncharacterized protein LOC117339897 [Pecten maximus]|uniref:uncharacterized protein LOC117339897 n=1 Tax=Pecten maximus TaxID=6579 RepID=UPI001458520E|nr:uncharacterized protein LOC117339897 [Pecten maximus]